MPYLEVELCRRAPEVDPRLRHVHHAGAPSWIPGLCRGHAIEQQLAALQSGGGMGGQAGGVPDVSGVLPLSNNSPPCRVGGRHVGAEGGRGRLAEVPVPFKGWNSRSPSLYRGDPRRLPLLFNLSMAGRDSLSGVWGQAVWSKGLELGVGGS